MHRWRTGHRDIPCQVASPKSLAPLLPMTQRYQGPMHFRNWWNRGRATSGLGRRQNSEDSSRELPQTPLDTGPMPQKSQGGSGGDRVPPSYRPTARSICWTQPPAATPLTSRSDGAPREEGGTFAFGHPVACLPRAGVVSLRGNHTRSNAAERRRYKTDSPQGGRGPSPTLGWKAARSTARRPLLNALRVQMPAPRFLRHLNLRSWLRSPEAGFLSLAQRTGTASKRKPRSLPDLDGVFQ